MNNIVNTLITTLTLAGVFFLAKAAFFGGSLNDMYFGFCMMFLSRHIQTQHMIRELRDTLKSSTILCRSDWVSPFDKTTDQTNR